MTDKTSPQTLQKTPPTGNLKNIVVRVSPNQGKDIGGKLVLIDSYFKSDRPTEFFIFFHDKKSPHEVQGFEWSQKLSRILAPDFIDKSIKSFTANKTIGIIASQTSIRNEGGTSSQNDTNSLHIKDMQSLYSVDTLSHEYVAGTMFWARSTPYINFFSRNHPFEIRRKLEKGNVMDIKQGSNTHAWERLLSWIASSQGYTIKGIA